MLRAGVGACQWTVNGCFLTCVMCITLWRPLLPARSPWPEVLSFRYAVWRHCSV